MKKSFFDDLKEDVKGAVDTAKEKIIEVTSDPDVVSASRFAKGMLDVGLALKGNINPVTIGAAAISSIDVLADAFKIYHDGIVEPYVAKHDLVMHDGLIHHFVATSNLIKDAKVTIVARDSNVQIHKIYFDDDVILYVPIADVKGAEGGLNQAIYSSEDYFIPRNFNFEKIYSMIWGMFPDGIYIDNKELKTSSGFDKNISSVNALISDSSVYIGKVDLEKLKKQILQFREKGVSRSYMFAGPPGVGKTSAAITLAKSISNRIVKIEPTTLSKINMASIVSMIESFKPDTLIFDDFDRATGATDSAAILFAMENIKSRFKNLVVFATVNDYFNIDPAIRRPGRFDQTIWFEDFDANVRAEIAEFYLNEMKVTYNDQLLEKIVVGTDGMSPIYIKELIVRISSVGDSHIDESVSEFRRSLGLQQPTSEDSNLDDLMQFVEDEDL